MKLERILTTLKFTALMTVVSAALLWPHPSSAAAMDATAVAVGSRHSCALTAAGVVKCWGWNTDGQLGSGTTIDETTPVEVVGLTSDVAAIAAGSSHTCALTTAGGVKCWGGNNSGQLGAETTEMCLATGAERSCSSTPVDVVALEGGVSALALGGAHTCALTTAGGVKCWGGNWVGQLGIGTTDFRVFEPRLTPLDVVGLASGVSAISAGARHTCALGASGGVKCWGSGYGPTPADVVGLESGVAAIAAGVSHTCAVTMDGGVKCWGENGRGQLGDGTTEDRTMPVDVTGLPSVTAVASARFNHTCALTAAGAVKCWGGNEVGQLGNGTRDIRPHPRPVDVIGLWTGVAAVSAGSLHTCALIATGGVACWGYNQTGEVGDGTTTMRTKPVEVPGLKPTDVQAPVGDVNCMGTINSIDAALILQRDAGLIEDLACEQNADVSGDGAIDPVDATLILQLGAGLIESLPA